MLTVAEIKEYLNRPEIVNAVANEDLEYVYKELDRLDRPALTSYLLELHIDPLEYVGYCCDSMYRNLSISKLETPPGIKYIDNSAFSHCTKLKEVVLNEDLMYIESCAFNRCPNLVSVRLPASIYRLGDYVFEECINLKDINLEDTLIQVIGSSAFAGNAGLKHIKLPSTVLKINADAFNCCSHLKSIDVGSNCDTIGYSAFEMCNELREVKLGTYTTRIGEYAFNHCESLEELVLPSGLKNIDYQAFGSCIKLKELKYEGTMEAFNQILLAPHWNKDSEIERVICTDGIVPIEKH